MNFLKESQNLCEKKNILGIASFEETLAGISGEIQGITRRIFRDISTRIFEVMIIRKKS